jgi:glycosyltransferase involved in cell wall biosynthesis
VAWLMQPTAVPERLAAGVATEPSQPSLLVVTTVAATIRGFLLPYAEHMRARGWRVEAAASGATDEAAIVEAFDQVHEVPLSRSITDLGGMIRSFRAVSRILDRSFDIVHVHTPIAGIVARAAVRMRLGSARPKVVYTAHGFHFHRNGALLTNTLFLGIEKAAGFATDRLVVINDDDAAAARRYRLLPPDRLRPMPGIGVDTMRYTRAAVRADDVEGVRHHLAIPEQAPWFLIIGELNANKRPTDVISALALMRHREAHLVLLGTGPAQAMVEEHRDRLGLQDRVHLMGEVADVRPWLAGCTALILASQREGLPRSIMEALSMEVPVITSAARGSRQLVSTDAGWVVPIGDVGEFAAAMDRALDQPEQACALGRHGREKMRERYDLPILLREHQTMYDDLLARRRARLARHHS